MLRNDRKYTCALRSGPLNFVFLHKKMFLYICNQILVAKLSLKSEFLRINAFRINHQFREEILEILRFRGVSAILIFGKKIARSSDRLSTRYRF